MKSLLIALLMLMLLTVSAVAEADEPEAAEETSIHLQPYAGLTVARPSGPDDWSTGFLFGMEVSMAPIWFGVSYHLHDILDEGDEVYPHDGTFEFGGGVAYPGYSVFGIGTTPYFGGTLSRPTSPATWSLGMLAGLEVAFEPISVDVRYQWHDVLSENEVFAQERFDVDGEVRLAVVTYFGD